MRLDVFACLQQDRIQHDLLMQREDLPVRLPDTVRAPLADRPTLPPHQQARLTDGEKAYARMLRRRGVSLKVVARRYRVSHQYMSAICASVKNEITWSDRGQRTKAS